MCLQPVYLERSRFHGSQPACALSSYSPQVSCLCSWLKTSWAFSVHDSWCQECFREDTHNSVYQIPLKTKCETSLGFIKDKSSIQDYWWLLVWEFALIDLLICNFIVLFTDDIVDYSLIVEYHYCLLIADYLPKQKCKWMPSLHLFKFMMCCPKIQKCIHQTRM